MFISREAARAVLNRLPLPCAKALWHRTTTFPTQALLDPSMPGHRYEKAELPQRPLTIPGRANFWATLIVGLIRPEEFYQLIVRSL